MIDDHKYSLNRIVAYPHPEPGHSPEAYGPGGPERTYGYVTEIHQVLGDEPRWEYSVTNSFTDETCRLPEDAIFHGANRGYLDLRRREGIAWVQGPPESAREDSESGFWRHTLREFTRKEIPKIMEREQDEARARAEGRDLELGVGDYIKVRGDLRPEMEPHHNLYAKVTELLVPESEYMDLPSGRHRTLRAYRVRMDSGAEAEILDVEVKAIYTRLERTVILNWRAALFLAEAFGDQPPYEVGVDYLNGHVFSRVELEPLDKPDLGGLLGSLLYAKGLVTRDEFVSQTESLRGSPKEYLVDQILATSRFDMKSNRQLSTQEIVHLRSQDERLRSLLE